MSAGGHRLPKIAIEVAVIVGSILLAFGIEAWWDERGDRIREQEAITRLIGEFEAIEDELARLRSNWSGDRPGAGADGEAAVQLGGMRAMERGLGLMNTGVGRPMADSIIASLIVTAGQARLPEGVLSALVSSGDLSLIRSDSLRASLAGWPSFAATVGRDVDAIDGLVEDRIIPFLWERIPLRTVDVSTGYHEGLGPSPFPYDPAPLFRDPYFENLLNEKLIQWETSVERLDGARDHVALVLRLLAASRTES